MRASLRGAMLALVVGVSGCSAWRVQTAPVREVAAGPVPRARVTLRDGARMQLWNARVEGDSLVGRLTDDTTRTAFAVADVATVETWGPSLGQTAKIAGFVAIGLAFAFLQFALAYPPP